jgi:uncharacterized membrane protein YhaH (DUF805 family)
LRLQIISLQFQGKFSKETAMRWYLAVWKKYAMFSGRARRKEFWIYQLFNILIMVVLLILGAANSNDHTRSEGTLGWFLFFVFYYIAAFIPSLAVTVRRLHDSGKSGWAYLIIFFPVGNIILLIFLMRDSTPGANEYGPNPKGIRGMDGMFWLNSAK